MGGVRNSKRARGGLVESAGEIHSRRNKQSSMNTVKSRHNSELRRYSRGKASQMSAGYRTQAFTVAADQSTAAASTTNIPRTVNGEPLPPEY